MTVAWYGHLKDRQRPLIIAILLSWRLAMFEYLFHVPANRAGYGRFTLTQLKILQECITLVVFTIFAFIIFGEGIKRNYLVSYALIVAADF